MPSLLLCCIRILLLSVGQLVYIHPNKSDFLLVWLYLHLLRMSLGVMLQNRGQEGQVCTNKFVAQNLLNLVTLGNTSKALKCVKTSPFDKENNILILTYICLRKYNGNIGKYALRFFFSFFFMRYYAHRRKGI